MELFILVMCVLLPLIALLGSSLNFGIIKYYCKSKARIVPLVYIILSSIHLAISLLALLQMISFASFPSFSYPYQVKNKIKSHNS